MTERDDCVRSPIALLDRARPPAGCHCSKNQNCSSFADRFLGGDSRREGLEPAACCAFGKAAKKKRPCAVAPPTIQRNVADALYRFRGKGADVCAISFRARCAHARGICRVLVRSDSANGVSPDCVRLDHVSSSRRKLSRRAAAGCVASRHIGDSFCSFRAFQRGSQRRSTLRLEHSTAPAGVGSGLVDASFSNGIPVPDEPTSPGENARILPPPHRARSGRATA